MPITVIPRGTDWRDTFMTGLGGLAIGALDKFLGQLQQNEQNRKINAFRAQANQDINDLVARENNGGISLTPQNLPEGYNSNGWANTLHNSYTPLTQFDVGTSAIPRRGATTQEIRNVIDNLAGTQRFNMINPDAVQGIRNDFVQAAEAQRLQSLQDKYAAQFQNAQSLPEQMKALALGVGHAGMPYQAMTAYSPFAVNSIPQFGDVDLGDQKLVQYRDPLTGQNRTVGQYRVGINPEKRLDADVRERIAQITANASTRNANIGAQADIYGHDTRNEIEMRKNELELRKLQIENIDSQIERLQKEADADYENVRNNLTGDKKQDEIILQEYSKRAEAIKAQIQELQKTKNEHFTGNKSWISADLFGKGRRITSPYGIRKDPFTGEKKNHKAIDYGFTEGEPIPLDPQLGETFRVIESRKSKSYGNTVVVEAGTTPDGRPITMRFAHMSDKSRQLKPGDVLKAGDIIGNAGSTGRATGPHLHFEVMIDGVQVDPNEFFKMRAQIQSQTQPRTQTRTASPQTSFFDTVRQTTAAPINAKKQREAVNNVALGIADRGNPQVTALGGKTNIPPEAVLVAPNGLSWITAKEIDDAAFNDNISAEKVMERLLANGYIYPDELGGAEQSQSGEQPQRTQAVQTQTENQNPTLWTDLKYFGGKVKDFVNLIPNSSSYQDYAHDAYSPQYRGKPEAQADFKKLESGDLSAIIPDMNRAYQLNSSQLRDLSPISDIDWTGNEWLRDLQLRNLPEITAQYKDKNRSNSGEKLPLNFTYPFATPLDIRQQLVDPFAFPPNGYFMYR